MKKILISLVVALSLVAVMVAPVMAAEESVTASVEVNQVISFTVTDYGTTGINFGTLNDGTTDNPEVAQTSGAGAVKLTVGSETNVDCDVEIEATGDFTGDGTLALSNAKWDKDNDVAGASTMTTTFALVGQSTAGTEYNQDVWHWLSIPDGQIAGSYNTTYVYSAT